MARMDVAKLLRRETPKQGTATLFETDCIIRLQLGSVLSRSGLDDLRGNSNTLRAGGVTRLGDLARRRGDNERWQPYVRFDAEAASASASKFSVAELFQILFLHAEACRSSAVWRHQESKAQLAETSTNYGHLRSFQSLTMD